MRKWYLITHADKEKEGREEVFYTERENLPKWTSCSPGYATLQALEKESAIADFVCCKCGGAVSLHFTNKDELVLNRMCYSCNHFRQIAILTKIDRTRLVINNTAYHYERDVQGVGFRGFGGREFRIKRFDSDEVVITHNLWCQGDIPIVWREDLPNNAEFLK